jgi:hypothetical protein
VNSWFEGQLRGFRTARHNPTCSVMEGRAIVTIGFVHRGASNNQLFENVCSSVDGGDHYGWNAFNWRRLRRILARTQEQVHLVNVATQNGTPK